MCDSGGIRTKWCDGEKKCCLDLILELGIKKKKKKFSYKIDYSLKLQFFLNINITIYFENLIIELHVIYVLNTYVKFCANKISFTI